MKLSILVVTYNQEKYIGQCLDSILTQKVSFDYEIVIADDCSTDNTPSIVKKYAASHSKIKPIFNEKNEGFVRNWKIALSHCTGDYVAILEGDDYWLTDYRIQRQVDFMDTTPEYGMCCAKAKVWDELTGVFVREAGSDCCENYETLIVDNNDVVTSTTVIRRHLFLKAYEEINQFLPEDLQWDTSIWFWFAANSKIKFINEYYEVYRLLPRSGSHTDDLKKFFELEIIRPKITLYFLQHYPLVESKKVAYVTEKLSNQIKDFYSRMYEEGRDEVRMTQTYKTGLALRNILELFRFRCRK